VTWLGEMPGALPATMQLLAARLTLRQQHLLPLLLMHMQYYSQSAHPHCAWEHMGTAECERVSKRQLPVTLQVLPICGLRGMAYKAWCSTISALWCSTIRALIIHSMQARHAVTGNHYGTDKRSASCANSEQISRFCLSA
jgi:hypothetical protein